MTRSYINKQNVCKVIQLLGGMMKDCSLTLLTSVFFVFLAACSPTAAVTEQPAAEMPEIPSGEIGVKSDRVLPNICELLPIEEVAAISGGTPQSEPNVEDYGDDFKGCWYDFDLGDGTYDYYIVYVEPASFLAATFEDDADPVPDLGDQAQLMWEDDGEQYRLAVLDGEIGVEIAGKRSDVMIELARLILERL